MTPTVGSPTRRIRRRISRYVPADGTRVTGPQARKMWNSFFPGPDMSDANEEVRRQPGLSLTSKNVINIQPHSTFPERHGPG